MSEEATRIVISVPWRCDPECFRQDSALEKGWVLEIKHSFLIGRVVAKGISLTLGGDSLGLFSKPWIATVLDTAPLGEVEITEDTEIEIEGLPYFTWEEKGVHRGRWEDHDKWMKDLRKKYGIS